MAIQKSICGNGYVISSFGTWLPGVYADTGAGFAAFKLPNDALERLRDKANAQARPITLEDIREERLQLKIDRAVGRGNAKPQAMRKRPRS